MNQLNLIAAVHALLIAGEQPGSPWHAVAGRIYFAEHPPGAPLPLLLFRLTADRPVRYFTASPDLRTTIEFEIVVPQSSGAGEAVRLNDLLLNKLDGRTFSHAPRTGLTFTAADRGSVRAAAHTLALVSVWELKVQTA